MSKKISIQISLDTPPLLLLPGGRRPAAGAHAGRPEEAELPAGDAMLCFLFFASLLSIWHTQLKVDSKKITCAYKKDNNN